jgi:hypothetical protein
MLSATMPLLHDINTYYMNADARFFLPSLLSLRAVVIAFVAIVVAAVVIAHRVATVLSSSHRY